MKYWTQAPKWAAGRLLILVNVHHCWLVRLGVPEARACGAAQVSNYATDMFTPIFAAIRAATGAEPYTDKVPRRGTGRSGEADACLACSMQSVGANVLMDVLQTNPADAHL